MEYTSTDRYAALWALIAVLLVLALCRACVWYGATKEAARHVGEQAVAVEIARSDGITYGARQQALKGCGLKQWFGAPAQ